MSSRVKVFIDYWNFQLSWNDQAPHMKMCDWLRLPGALLGEAEKRSSHLAPGDSTLEGTLIYASYNPATNEDIGLKQWLNDFLDGKNGISVIVDEREEKPVKFHCKQCDKKVVHCPSCKRPLVGAPEKRVDVAIATALMRNAWEDTYDVAILVSSDSDLIPCVRVLQDKGFEVVNARWGQEGEKLAHACSDSFDMSPLVTDLILQPKNSSH